MRKIYKKVLTEGEAKTLRDFPYLNPFNTTGTASLEWDNPSVQKLTSLIKKDLPKIKLSLPSYSRVERQARGHLPHFDGCKLELGTGRLIDNHMPWCKYSVSVLLSKPRSFKGGIFKFLTSPKKSFKRDAYLNMAVYSSSADNDPQEHMVTPHEGDRCVLLMFLAEEDE